MAMEMPANVVNQMQEKLNDRTSEADDLVFTPTGKSETINGFDCDEYTFIVDSQTVSAWFAKDLKEKEKISVAFKQLAESSNPMAASMAKFDDMPGVPIRTEVDLPGSGKTAVTLQSISTDPIPADVFDIPAGYQSMAMPQIPGVN